jgi:pimeloyl-ACP methyl ester carboxylesterase
MSSSSSPTVVLVPGACHTAACYELLIPHLERAGFPVKALTLPSINHGSPTEATCAEDANFIRNTVLLPLIEEGKDILLVGHSYGGVPISAAAFGLSKRTRSKTGKTGGVIGLVYISALMVGAEKQLMSSADRGNTPLIYDSVSRLRTPNTPFFVPARATCR